jgi:hypothetical protein
MIRLSRALLPVLLVLALVPTAPGRAGAWGGVGHRSIASQYGESLPPSLQALRSDDAWVTDHVMDADLRKGTVPTEGYRHYIDIDAYPEYHAGTLPHDRAELESRYGAAQVQQWGVAPWAIGEVVDSLSAAMARGDWTGARTWIADLCHYVGDLHQPLHATLNYDGQLTGNHGIHSRYETQMLNLYAQWLQLDAGTVSYLADPVDAAFAIATASQQAVPQVITADNEARAAAGGSTSSSTYYAGLWSRTSGLTIARMTGASVETASFVYTAWVDAGYPAVPGSTVDVPWTPPAGAGALALAAGTLPARGSLDLRYALPRAGLPVFELVDVRGRRVARLAAGPSPAGPGRLSWPLGRRSRSPGVYFVRLSLDGEIAHARVVVVAP